MYRLYGFNTPNVKKVLYVLSELNVPYEFEKVDLAKGEQKGKYASKLPAGKVPVLQHDDELLFESATICRYLASVENSPLYPADKLKRARVEQWMDYFTNHLGRWLTTLFFEYGIKSFLNLGAPDDKACEEANKFIAMQAKTVDDHLAKNKFLTGNNLSIADLFAYAYVETAPIAKVDLSLYPHLKRWAGEIAQLPSVKKINAQNI
ncbi:glutathione S-transferase family protein [bacterium]|nr:glutathione S-transferase family protein [bacterium]